MPEILGSARTISQLLKGVKYSVDYYQREYRWEEKQIAELIADLTDKFMGDFDPGHPREEVANYGHYFLGAIIISRKDNINYIVDGQQRITSLTLLLIYLRNLQKAYANKVNIDELIFSEKFGNKSFNLEVDDRSLCMEALFSEQPFDATDRSDSIQNIVARYSDIEGLFPDDLAHETVLPYFIDWLIENVHLVEITAYSDDDAYTIFETMNDRGLSLSMTEMLKGFLLSSISDSAKRNHANDFWKKRIEELNDLGKDTDSDCFKAWLRSQYSMKIRERKKNAAKEDFDKIGSEYHRWIRENEITLGLTNSDSFYNFIDRNFNFYSRQYMRLLQVSRKMTTGFEIVLYNWNHGFTLQYMLLLSPLKPDDPEDIINLKLLLVSRFIDILLAWRIWNYRSIAYSTMQYAMFLVMREIRGLDVKSLAQKLLDILEKENETFASNDKLHMHQQNKWYLHRILARITDYVEEQSGNPSHYVDYIINTGKNRFEVEHIWADKPERHIAEFSNPNDFKDYRNHIGGLLLLPKSFNASYGASTYEEKLPQYFSQNMLARSLNKDCYQLNPGFLKFVQQSKLPFKSYDHFAKADLDERYELYRQIANQIWNPELIRIEAGL